MSTANTEELFAAVDNVRVLAKKCGKGPKWQEDLESHCERVFVQGHDPTSRWFRIAVDDMSEFLEAFPGTDDEDKNEWIKAVNRVNRLLEPNLFDDSAVSEMVIGPFDCQIVKTPLTIVKSPGKPRRRDRLLHPRRSRAFN
jgi:hypothetical protein